MSANRTLLKATATVALGALTAMGIAWNLRRAQAQPTVPPQANPIVPATFVLNGPEGFHTVVGKPPTANGLRAGAINALVVHPTNADIIWVGTVNGGVWKTTNATTPSGNPTWTPLTDHQPSLSIAALALDPTFSTADVLVAGLGRASSFGKEGPLAGILRTTDGGTTWTQLGATELSNQSLSAIAARGPVIVAAARTGIWLSTNTGGSFNHLDAGAGLPDPGLGGAATDLQGDPSNSARVYAAITNSGGGVFRSDDSGASWLRISGSNFGGAASSDIVKDAHKIVLAIHASGGISVIYAALIDKDPTGVFRSTDQGATWSKLDTPDIEAASQGRLSIAADPDFPNYVYLGGDESPGGDGEGPVYRCDANKAPGAQCTKIVTDGTASDTAPHPDSRRLQFDANGNLLETDDGGIFKRTSPRNALGDWTSLNGNLSITEPHSCAYDHIAHVTICGTQDNGTVLQPAPGALVWDSVAPFDGGVVAVTEGDVLSSRYYSTQRLGSFSLAKCDAANTCTVSKPALKITTGQKLNDTNDPGVTAYTPIASHAKNPHRLVIATGTVDPSDDSGVYESDDSGDNLTRLAGFTGVATRAIAYGSEGNANVLYVGSSTGLFRRTSTLFGGLTRLATYTFDEPVDIALDPDDWQSVWVLTRNSVLHTPDAGETWFNVTADLGPSGAGAEEFNTIAFIPRSSASVIAVGASDGLYATDTAQLGHWYKLGGALPNAVVQDLEYDASDDVLLVTTLGRSTWLVPHAQSISLPSPTILTYTGDTSVDYHDIAHLSATLTASAQGQPVDGQTVSFTIGSQSCTGVTGTTGVAACQLSLTQVPGSYPLAARFNGNVSFAPSSASAGFAIAREETTLHYTGDTLIAQGQTAHMAGLLREDDVAPISGRTVTFTLGSGMGAQTCSATTNPTGRASCDIANVSQPLGPGKVIAVFSGDVLYLPSSAEANTIVFAYTAGGNFVVGDLDAGGSGTVTFWGSSWSSANHVSGGTALSSFKGFANNPAGATSCGGTWSTSPGNSPAPPGSVPSYTAMLVTNSVTQSGSTISGTKPSLVIVRTNDGYEPSPGHPGTGQVVAVLCQ